MEVKNTSVEIHRVVDPDIESKLRKCNDAPQDLSESDSLKVEFEEIDVNHIRMEETLKPIIGARMAEMKSCFSAQAYLSVIFLAGSMLEGILLSMANRYPKEFNQSPSAPKNKEGKNKLFPEWSFKELITVANNIGILKEDIAKFSHALRDFRNYIHPYQQMSENFYPDENTAKICMQVMKGLYCKFRNITSKCKLSSIVSSGETKKYKNEVNQ